ncbi:MAG: nuclear transport factor 2 family protein [Acidimicrobiia bacterium]
MATIDELRRRLDAYDDEKAIVAAMYRYGDALDHDNRDEFLACFTPDARYDVIMRFEPANSFAFTGHAELTQYFKGHTHRPNAFHKHVTTNPLVTVHGDTADAQSYFLRVDSLSPGNATVLAAGRYVDKFVRSDDGTWKIKTRRCEVENL